MIRAARRSLGARLGRALIILAPVVSAGCAGAAVYPTYPAPETLPASSPLLSRSLGQTDAWLRHYLLTGQAREALEIVDEESPTAPDDDLLRAMMEALVLHQAGEYERSNEVFAWVEREADLRFTRSLSRMGGSLLINDRVMKYTPSATELRMIPYYRMLNYLAMDDLDGAVVEARKAGALLDRLDDDADACGQGALLEYLAAAVRDRVDDASGAAVSMRRAEHRFAECDAPGGVRPPARMASEAPGDSAGSVMILIEHGFVAHRAEEELHIPIFRDELNDLDGDGDERIGIVADRITARTLADLGDDLTWGRYDRRYRWARWGNSLDDAYILRLAWPVCRLEANAPAGIRVLVGDSVIRTTVGADISATVRSDLAAAMPATLTRMVARGIAKYLVTREVEEAAEEEGGELLGFLTGRIVNLVANGLEQADTRSWSILPNRISVAEAVLPPGVYPVRVEALGPRGEVVATHELGSVKVEAGGRTILSDRVWGHTAETRSRSRALKARS
ncbi:MAG TPA: hypothetical protein VFI91_09840 [Longimicrobiaceae bacterium]|nr:hypothetical protein [Longimicrobiaceae bacterium]